jgi:hypothetical protein
LLALLWACLIQEIVKKHRKPPLTGNLAYRARSGEAKSASSKADESTLRILSAWRECYPFA